MWIEVLTFIFALLIIAAIGPNITYAFWIQRGLAERAALPFALRGIKNINDWVVLPAFVLTAITGFVIANLSDINLSTTWLLLALASWVIAFLLGIFGYSPALRNQISLSEESNSDQKEYDAFAWRSMLIGIVIGVLAIVSIALMVFQPAF